MRMEKNLAFQEFLQNLIPTEDTNYSLWKVTHKIKNQPSQPIPPDLRKHDRTWARTNYEKTITFAEHLEKVF